MFYLFLCWVSKESQKEAFDLRSLPPIGRFLPMLMNIQDRKFRKASAGAPNAKSGSRSGPRKPAERGGGRNSSSEPRRDRGSRGGSQVTGSSSKPSKRGSSGRSELTGRGKDHDQQDSEEQALKAVEDAIILLNSKPALKTVKLKPQNSFMRRLQHKKIAEMGLESTSVGEDRNRAVKIVKN